MRWTVGFETAAKTTSHRGERKERERERKGKRKGSKQGKKVIAVWKSSETNNLSAKVKSQTTLYFIVA